MKIKFVIEDFWIGIFWKTELMIFPKLRNVTTFYICLIPCFPIIFEFYSKYEKN